MWFFFFWALLLFFSFWCSVYIWIYFFLFFWGFCYLFFIFFMVLDNVLCLNILWSYCWGWVFVKDYMNVFKKIGLFVKFLSRFFFILIWCIYICNRFLNYIGVNYYCEKMIILIYLIGFFVFCILVVLYLFLVFLFCYLYLLIFIVILLF